MEDWVKVFEYQDFVTSLPPPIEKIKSKNVIKKFLKEQITSHWPLVWGLTQFLFKCASSSRIKGIGMGKVQQKVS